MAALLALGPVVFAAETLPVAATRRGSRYRWASHRPIGSPPRREFVGVGDDELTVHVALGQGLGNRLAVDALRLLAGRGAPHVLADATGRLYGWWCVVAVREAARRFHVDFQPRRSTVAVDLLRSDPGLALSVPSRVLGAIT